MSRLSDRTGFRPLEAMGVAQIFLQSDRTVGSKLIGVNEPLGQRGMQGSVILYIGEYMLLLTLKTCYYCEKSWVNYTLGDLDVAFGLVWHGDNGNQTCVAFYLN